MKTMFLRDGDFVLSNRSFVTVSGTGKIAQDLRCAMLEPIGNDRFHTGWGSTLDQMISAVADEHTRTEVEAEVNRIITNYAAVQQDRISMGIASEEEPVFTTSDILSRIESVTVELDGDAIHVGVRLRAASGEVVVINEAVS